MAVDVMHLSPSESFTKMAFGQSKSAEELKESTYQDPELSIVAESPTTCSSGKSSLSSSLTDLSLSADGGRLAVEQLNSTRKQLEREIDHLVGEISRIGEDMNCTAECTQLLQDSEEDLTKKQLRRGRKIFNSKPSEGIKYLIEKGLLNQTPEDVALFLFVNDQLDKKSVGEYLGEGKQFNITVLHQFVSLHKFHGLDLVTALRAFLGSFTLPGEAQKIDRMMESFAERFCQCNPGVFETTDACYILSFSIIMLNTSLHNPNVKQKPTLESFISMNRNVNNGKDFPVEMLQGLFESIRSSQFHYHHGVDELSEVFFNPDHEGFLVKEGGKHKTWRKRWFVLTDNCLYYFKSPSDKEPRGIIPLENLEVRVCPEAKRNHCFEICMNEKLRHGTIKACKTNAEGKVVVGHHMNYRIQAESAVEMDEWMKRIQASISRNPFLEMLQDKRQRASKTGPVGL